MPEGTEYLHCVQMALDDEGLRYQVIDDEGQVRERLSWPLRLPSSGAWSVLGPGHVSSPLKGFQDPAAEEPALLAFRFSGRTATDTGYGQTFVSVIDEVTGAEPLWIGLTGRNQRLTAIVQPWPANSPHYWFGPEFGAGSAFDFQFALHGGMGPGGLLWRSGDDEPWSSLHHRSPWGMETIDWPRDWFVGHGPQPDDRPFAGTGLLVRHHVQGV
jgi:hypothetical protein